MFNSHDAVLKESTFNNVTLFQQQSGLNSIESLNAIKPYGIIMGGLHKDHRMVVAVVNNVISE